MSFISSILISFCAACVFIGALYIICPEGTMSKPIKYVLSLVFLISVIASAGVVAKTQDFSMPEIPEYEIDSERLDTANAELVFSYALKAAGIDFSKISVLTDKSEADSIIISKVLIYSGSSYEEICKALGSAAEKIEVVVINE